jgi:hypothetical protein
MTLRQAISTLIAPWTTGAATFQEWELACLVIQAAMERDDAERGPVLREAASPAAPEETTLSADEQLRRAIERVYCHYGNDLVAFQRDVMAWQQRKPEAKP